MAEAVSFPRSWRFHSDDSDKPADGPTFRGRFTGVIELAPSQNGDTPVARFIEEESGDEVSIWLFNIALKDQLAKLAPETGELVQIDYHGKKKSQTSGRPYKSFKATAPEREVPTLSWGALAAVDEEEDED